MPSRKPCTPGETPVIRFIQTAAGNGEVLSSESDATGEVFNSLAKLGMTPESANRRVSGRSSESIPSRMRRPLRGIVTVVIVNLPILKLYSTALVAANVLDLT